MEKPVYCRMVSVLHGQKCDKDRTEDSPGQKRKIRSNIAD